MRKLFKFFTFVISFFFTLSIIPSSKIYASEEFLDQYYLGQCCNVYTLSSESKVPVYQIFVPTIDQLTKVSIEFSSYMSIGYSYTVNIVDENNDLLASATNSSVKAGWSTFVFSPVVELAPGEIHKIELAETTKTAVRNFQS